MFDKTKTKILFGSSGGNGVILDKRSVKLKIKKLKCKRFSKKLFCLIFWYPDVEMSPDAIDNQ